MIKLKTCDFWQIEGENRAAQKYDDPFPYLFLVDSYITTEVSCLRRQLSQELISWGVRVLAHWKEQLHHQHLQ